MQGIRRLVLGGFMAVALLGLGACKTADVVKQDYSSYVWPKAPSSPKIKLIHVISTDLDVRQLSPEEKMFGQQLNFSFNKPHGIAADKSGNIYVSDTFHQLVKVMNLDQGTITNLNNPEGFLVPMHIDVDDEAGLVAVADSLKKKVYVFDMSTLRLKFAISGPTLQRPVAVAFHPRDHRIFVADTKLHNISVYSPSGQFIQEIVAPGYPEGYVYYPQGIEIDDAGDLYVVDTMNFRFQVFDSEGNFIRSVGQHGDFPGDFARPKDITISDDGIVFVTDAAFGNFQIFRNDGRLLMYIGSTGRTPGRFRIPTGIYIDHRDRIYVADSIGRRVQVFQYLSPRYLAEHPEEGLPVAGPPSEDNGKFTTSEDLKDDEVPVEGPGPESKGPEPK